MIIRTVVDPNVVAYDCGFSIGVFGSFTFSGLTRSKIPKWRGRLLPSNSETSRGNRRVYAVCVHGHYAFAKALFAADPNATIESSLTRSRDASMFRGGVFHPLVKRNLVPFFKVYGDLCTCSGSPYSFVPHSRTFRE